MFQYKISPIYLALNIAPLYIRNAHPSCFFSQENSMVDEFYFLLCLPVLCSCSWVVCFIFHIYKAASNAGPENPVAPIMFLICELAQVTFRVLLGLALSRYHTLSRISCQDPLPVRSCPFYCVIYSSLYCNLVKSSLLGHGDKI